MKIVVQRTVFTERSTIGQMFVDDVFQCHTLEDRDRFIEDGHEKVYKETAMPRGLYKLTVNMSDRFKRPLPLIHNVPQFTGVRIHSGNHEGNTEGCILVGTYKESKPDWISNSRDAFKPLFEKICNALDDMEPVTLEVI